MGDWFQGILGLDSGGSDDERVSAEEEEKWGKEGCDVWPPWDAMGNLSSFTANKLQQDGQCRTIVF